MSKIWDTVQQVLFIIIIFAIIVCIVAEINNKENPVNNLVDVKIVLTETESSWAKVPHSIVEDAEGKRYRISGVVGNVGDTFKMDLK
jgi:uncharacterized protein YoxC